MSEPVFTRLEVYHKARGGTLLAWSLNQLFSEATPYTFSVYASRSGVGDWQLVTTVQDTYVAEDPTRWIYGKAPRLHYKVALTTGEGRDYVSDTEQAAGMVPDREVPIIKDIIRRETLRLTKQAGMCGLLYKRRVWGPVCSSCTDFNTGEVSNAKCPECYGTGIVRGYFDPVEYWISESTRGVRRRKVTDEKRNVVNPRVFLARGLNCPWLDAKDVWVSYVDDRRYFVHTVQEITTRGLVLLFDPIELRLAPTSDIVYTLPRPEDVESSSSS